MVAAVACAAVAMAADRMTLAPPVLAVASLTLVAAMALPATHVFRQQCDEEDTVAARLAVFLAKTGTDPTDEYTPGEADNDTLQRTNPPSWLGQSADVQPPQGHPGQVRLHFSIEATKREYLILNLREYPAWRVRLNGDPVTEKVERADGLIAFEVPAGSSKIDIAYASSGDMELGEGTSLAALCGTLGILVAGRMRRRSRIIDA